MITKPEIDKLLDELIALGEDSEEMEYWRTVFEDMQEEEQAMLYANLTQELNALKTASA